MKEQSGIDSDAPEDEQQEQVSNFQDNNEQEIEEVNKDLDMSAWEQFGLNVLIIKGLRQLGFSAPTEIQAQVLLPAIEHKRDILGAAETVSYQ